ncbi:calcium-binding protein, partial [Lyngbya sp. CCY1209]|uniref:calcium-binding protein n=1 Tax=Lyngbya sp. CCY1209 TaxID=2886103 RepID=UPI002D202905
MATAFFDFENFRGNNFAAIGTEQGVEFRNAIALVSVDAGGEGLFPAIAPTPGTTVLSYAEGSNFTLDIRELAPEGIAGGRLSFNYTSPNVEHSVKILDGDGNSLGTATLSSTAGRTFNVFSPFSISLPADAATIQIGSRATELAIDDLRISVDPLLVAEPLAAETPENLEGTDQPDFIDAATRSAIVSLPGDSIEAGVRFAGVSGQNNGDATILEGGTAIEFVSTIASGEGRFDYTVRFNNQTAFSTATVTVPEVGAIAGLGGNDTLSGTRGAETLDGGPDNDSIRGLTGNDTLDGGSGSDSLFGDGDGDLILGGADDDILFGGSGDDSLEGGIGDDTLDGGIGNDTMNGGEGEDVLLGRVGADVMNGDAGNDTLQGDKDSDTLSGGEDDDLLLGGAAPDTLFGGMGDDSLFGGQDDDSLFGDVGNDSLVGDGGVDTLQGGEGEDSFTYLSPKDGGTVPDRILDFNPAEDVLVFNSEPVAEDGTGGFGLSAVSLETQTLNLGQFFTAGDSLPADIPVLIYDNLSGILEYDFDGSGDGEAIAIAQFEPDENGNIPELSPERIFLVNPVDVKIPELSEVVAESFTATTPNFINGTEENDSLSATAPQPVDISVLDNDSPTGGLFVADISNISGGEAEVINNTTIRFTPTIPAPSRGSFLYTASDGTNSDLASVFVEIISVETISGFGGNDSLIGGEGNEFLLGGEGDDSLFGNQGDDVLRGEIGNDLMYGGADNDSLFGESGDDQLFGGSGIDFLYGGLGVDFLSGESGDDFLSGDQGNDTLQGGEGRDTFAYLSPQQVGEGQQDAIADFEPGSDVIVFNRST